MEGSSNQPEAENMTPRLQSDTGWRSTEKEPKPRRRRFGKKRPRFVPSHRHVAGVGRSPLSPIAEQRVSGFFVSIKENPERIKKTATPKT